MAPTNDVGISELNAHNALVDVEVSTEDNLLCWSAVMLANGKKRLPLLRKLVLSTGYLGEEAVEALNTLFTIEPGTPPIRVHTLELPDAELLLESDPRLIDTFAKLTSIETLRINNTGLRTVTMLSKLQSSLSVVDISLPDTSSRDALPDDRQMSNPVVLFQNSAETLEKLTASCAVVIAQPSLVYPSMRDLTLQFPDFKTTGTYDYIAAYPNLRNLSVSESWLSFLARNPIDKAKRWRNANIHDQGQYGTWKSLNTVSGDIFDVYVLGLQCRVSRLELTSERWGRPNTKMLEDVLNDTHPEEVYLTTVWWLIVDRPGLLSALQGNRVRYLKTLALTVKVGSEATQEDVCRALSTIYGIVASLPITRVDLSIKYVENNTDSKEPIPRSELGEGPLHGSDAKGIACRLMERCKTVRRVEVSLSDDGFRDCAFVLRGWDHLGDKGDMTEDGEEEEDEDASMAESGEAGEDDNSDDESEDAYSEAEVGDPLSNFEYDGYETEEEL